ncbi:MAG TPA: hypothetical protein VF131_26245 [Blastocatellia bacterium]|nr:hypothetical protein [Blastocatellia bacterium]
MNPQRFCTLFLVLALMLAGCSTGKNSQTAGKQFTPDGNSQGSLTINEKEFPLKYVYAGRKPAPAGEQGKSVEILIANEPIPQETLTSILLERETTSWLSSKSGIPEKATLKALHFEFVETILNSNLGFGDDEGKRYLGRGRLLIPENVSSFSNSGKASFKDGKFKAELGEEIEDYFYSKEENKQVDIKARFSVSFEVDVKDETLLSKSLSGVQPSPRLPDEGKATGAMTVSDETRDLKYAYALREKIEKTSEDIITVLITDKPIPKEFLMHSFDRAIPQGFYGLYLYFNPSGEFKGFTLKHPYGFMGDREVSLNGLKLEDGKIAGAVQYKGEKGENSYSVTFDAPLKD